MISTIPGRSFRRSVGEVSAEAADQAGKNKQREKVLQKQAQLHKTGLNGSP